MPQPAFDFDVIVLGAGASGLMCAATAGQRGRRVLVLERANRIGKKILMSGGGRCNFTNYSVEADNFISANPHFCKSALKRYNQWDFISMVGRYAIDYEERKHQQLFCRDSAKPILDMLENECLQAGVEIRTHCELSTVARAEDGGFVLSVEQQGRPGTLRCQSLVVATGGLSIPTLGGSGIGYQLAEQFGLKLVPRHAGLVPFTFSDQLKPICERLAGLALDVEVSCNGQHFSEAMLFTHRGLSGPAMLQISNYWQAGDPRSVDLLPGLDATAWLLEEKQQQPRSRLKTRLAIHLAKSLVAELQALWWPADDDTALAEMPDRQLREIGAKLNSWQLKPSGTEGYRTAEVTLGGVSTDDVSSKTMEAKHCPGLFFIGEVIDVSGHLGGFNFQWAWSSGYTAGQFA